MRARQILGDTRPAPILLGWGLGGVFANLPALLIIGGLGAALFRFLPEPSHPAVDQLIQSRDPMTIARIFVAAVIFAPILEEVIFRGLLMPAIARVTGSVGWGVALSSFLFAAIHPQGIAAWLGLATVGAMCALITVQTRSLIPAMVLHALHNGALLVVNLVLFA